MDAPRPVPQERHKLRYHAERGIDELVRGNS